MLRTLLSLATALVVVAAAACSSDDSVGTDGGPDATYDVAPGKDVVVGDAQACGPVDVSGYQATPLTPPNPPHQNKCTTQQVSDYAQCQGAGVTSLCQQFADGQPGQTCRQCIETQTTDPRWGVIVFSGSNKGVFNIEGCVDDALDQVTDEKANGGTGSCGDLLFASYGCQQAACGACTGTDFDACTSAAVAGGCKPYDTPVESDTGPCAALLGDAAPGDSASCFPDPTITDTTQQEVDWLNRIVGYMCGP
jgi:hypothetical protein